jgi:hypothetical protein
MCPEELNYLFVRRMNTGVRIKQRNNRIGFFDSDDRLRNSVTLDLFRRVSFIAAGVDDVKWYRKAVYEAVVSVAGNAGNIFDYRTALAIDRIE